MSDWETYSKSLTIAIYGSDGTLTHTLTNKDVSSESMNLEQTLEDSDNLSFIGCNASVFSIGIKDLEEDVRGCTLTATISAGTSSKQIFKGIIEEQENLTHEDIITNITAYDQLYEINNSDYAEWYDGLTFPLTLSSFRSQFMTHVGLQQESTTLLFDTMQITKTIDPEQLSGKDILSAICSLNGVYGRINGEGNFEYISLGSDTYSIDKSEYSSASYEAYVTDPIDKVQIRTDEDDIGAIYGTGTNAYVIEGNFLAYDKSETDLSSMAQSIYNKVSGITYCPADITLSGLPSLELGQYITFTTSKNTVNTYVLKRTLSGIQSLTDEYVAEGTKTRSEEVNSVNSSITQLKGRANRLTRTIDETNSKIDDVEEGLESQITQTKSDIELQITDLQSQIDGSINVYEREGEPTLLNYPAWDFTYNIPCNDTVQTTEDLHFLYISDYYKKNQRALCYDMTNAQTYRFRKDDSGTYYWEVVQDTEYSVLLSRITALEVKDGEIEASIEETNETVSGHTTSITTLSSTVTQTSSAITAEVSRASSAEDTIKGSLTLKIDKTDNDQIVSMINASANVISLKSNRLEISSDYFTLKKDGTLTATNGNFSGTITSTSGTIGGLTIASDGIYKSSSGYRTIWQNDGTLVCYDSSNNVKWALQSGGGAIFNGNVSIAGYATSSELNAVSANIDKLTAKAITTDNFSAQNINANKITSGTLSVSRMDVDTLAASGFSGKGISCYSLTASYGITTAGLNVAGSAATWRKIVGSNGSFMALCQ